MSLKYELNILVQAIVKIDAEVPKLQSNLCPRTKRMNGRVLDIYPTGGEQLLRALVLKLPSMSHASPLAYQKIVYVFLLIQNRNNYLCRS